MIEVIADRNGIWNPTISLYGRERLGDRTAYLQPVISKIPEHPEVDPVAQVPFLVLYPEAAQQLMDSLWDCGLRPSEGSGSAGALAATQRHLEDMRKLVFEK